MFVPVLSEPVRFIIRAAPNGQEVLQIEMDSSDLIEDLTRQVAEQIHVPSHRFRLLLCDSLLPKGGMTVAEARCHDVTELDLIKFPEDDLADFLMLRAQGHQPECPVGYTKAASLLVHEASGIKVRCPALQFQLDTTDSGVFYHLTDEAGFVSITNCQEHSRCIFRTRHEHSSWGEGVYLTRTPPQLLGSKDRVLKNNMTNASGTETVEERLVELQPRGIADYCVPVILPTTMVVDVTTQQAVGMQRVGHGKEGCIIRPDRDIWLFQHFDHDSGVITDFCEPLEVLYHQLRDVDSSVRRDAVGGLAGRVASGDEQAAKAAESLLQDEDCAVRIAAVRTFAKTTTLSSIEKAKKLTDMSSGEAEEFVRTAIHEALMLVHTLSSFFLARQANLPPPLGYQNGFGVLLHTSTGVTVLSDPLNLCGSSDLETIVLYQYTDERAFRLISFEKKIRHLRTSSQKRAHFGDGVYATSKSSDMFTSKDDILVNNYCSVLDTTRQASAIAEWNGRADFCVPIVVPRAHAVDVTCQMTQEMKATLGQAGYDLDGRAVWEGRDVWVIAVRTKEDGEAEHAMEDSDTIFDRLQNRDWSVRVAAVLSLRAHLSQGCERAAAALMQAFEDQDHQVRVAALDAGIDEAMAGSVEVAKKIKLLSDDSHPFVRQRALAAASQLQNNGLHDHLI